jgi:hypothetical protein
MGGVVFKLNKDGTDYVALHSFTGYPFKNASPVGFRQQPTLLRQPVPEGSCTRPFRARGAGDCSKPTEAHAPAPLDARVASI